MGRDLFRIDPKAGPESFKTYSIVAPARTHFRKATCAEVECRHFLNGWATRLDAAGQGGLIATLRHSGRPFRETVEGTVHIFTFEPGTPCFKESTHRVPLERDPVFVVGDGDYRGNPRGTRPANLTADQWVDDFATHQQKIADAIERGSR